MVCLRKRLASEDDSFGSNGEILSNGPHFKWNLVAISGLVVAIIGLNLWLIPVYGLDGAGFTLVIAYAIFNTTKAIYLWHKERIQPFGTAQYRICTKCVHDDLLFD